MGWIGFKIKSASRLGDTKTSPVGQDGLSQSSNVTSTPSPAAVLHSAHISEPQAQPPRSPRAPGTSAQPSARCRRRPGTSQDGSPAGDDRAEAAAPTPPTAPGHPRPALALPAGARPGAAPGRRSRSEQSLRAKLGARLPAASLHPPRPRPRLRPPPRPSHRPPARLSANSRAFRPPRAQCCRRPTGAAAAAASRSLLRFLPSSSGFPSPPRVARRKPARRPASSLASPSRPMGPRSRAAAPAPWRWRTERAPQRTGGKRGGEGPESGGRRLRLGPLPRARAAQSALATWGPRRQLRRRVTAQASGKRVTPPSLRSHTFVILTLGQKF